MTGAAGATAPVAYGEEDYTDYSCSTPLERLSRDVETVLRTWHIDQGCDRHVSLLASSTVASTTTAHDIHPTHNSNHNTHDKNDNPSSFFNADDPTCPLIRSTTLTWHVPLTTREGRSTVTIDLELALWDAPGGTDVGLGDDWQRVQSQSAK